MSIVRLAKTNELFWLTVHDHLDISGKWMNKYL